MNIRIRAGLVTLAVTAIFPLTFAVWPAEVPATAPGSAQALGYGLVAVECLALGTGVAFLVFGYSGLRRLPVSHRLALAAYLAIGFDLLNWWAHDHLHAVAGQLDSMHSSG
jgi:hypothetical protein